jgi:hypothetical protein
MNEGLLFAVVLAVVMSFLGGLKSRRHRGLLRRSYRR